MEVQRSEGGPRTIRKHLEVYVGNIPTAITEIEILQLFAGFEAQNVRKFVAGVKCFAFVDVGSERNVQLAVSQLNSTLYQGRKLRVNTADPDFSDKRRSADKDTPKTQATPTGAGNFVRMEKAAQASDSSAASLAPDPRKPSKDQSAPLSGVTVREDRRRFVYAVPTEMRGCTLVHVLRDCFRELVWLQSITELCGEVGLLLTETHPQTPFFWAIHLSEGAHADMLRLFTALAEEEEESRQPFLTKNDVYRGKRCLAELIQTEGEEGAWNRAWVQDVVGMFAVVFFVDFGTTATIPVMSLRALEDEAFWKIPPLAQPFMLEQDILSPRKLIRAVIKGNVTGSCVSEPHIRRLALSPQQD
ncbi:tudor domain-containing protein 10-like [Acipenser oxyrinchus oxyrinchus]|uniref:Tudor domain-containing protein 10-like n=1 Tax=Acipenser oxyrinchus oxyrinchus TaxID=40147 RepID=A0AAD8FP36_ACIOX|nr:tudor domain-containing protein 10-like [Acipenser oxyrinchus oxyrinchus]